MLSKAREVKDQLGLFSKMRDRIKRDDNLTANGKARAGANLEESIKAYRPAAIEALAAEWREARREYASLQERGRSAEAAVEASYDYTKLAYHRQLAEQLIAREIDQAAVEELVRMNVGSGDKEKRRGWLEAWPVVEKRGGGAGWMREALERELTPVTMPKLMADKNALLPQIAELHRITKDVEAWYGATPNGFTVSDFGKLTAGVSIQSYVKDGEYTTQIDLSDPAEAAPVAV